MGFLKRLVERLRGPAQPCMTCGQLTRDELVRAGRQRSRYCRAHLLEEFARAFEKTPYRMVVYEYQPQAAKHTGIVYGYYPLDALREFNWSEEDADRLRRILQEIDASHSCQSCGRSPWQVAYFDSAAAPWQEGSVLPEVRIDQALRLCTGCAAFKLVPILRENPQEYIEGLFLPFQGDGMYTTTQI